MVLGIDPNTNFVYSLRELATGKFSFVSLFLLKKSKVTIYYKIQDSGTQSELQTITINNTLTFLEAKEQNRRLSLKYLKSQIYILYYQLSKDVSSNTSDVL